MEGLFVIGDIHGEYNMLEKLLLKWNPDNQRLVFLGDYIDRGLDSYKVLQCVMGLKKEYGAITIGGNHESNFLGWLENPEDEWFKLWKEDESLINEYKEIMGSSSVIFYGEDIKGYKTINSFYGKNRAFTSVPSEHAKYIKDNFCEEVNFLKKLIPYYEFNKYVFVHAGVDFEQTDWKNTTKYDMCNIRKKFHNGENKTGKTFIFGHHPTRNFHSNKSNDIWVSSCKTKIGIDGGAAYKGLLHGLIIENENLIVHSIDNKGNHEMKYVGLKEGK